MSQAVEDTLVEPATGIAPRVESLITCPSVCLQEFAPAGFISPSQGLPDYAVFSKAYFCAAGSTFRALVSIAQSRQ
jgi:hypothetical protein